MKAILMIGAMFFAFSFCGLQEKLKQMQSGSNGNSSSSNSAKTSGSTEKAKPTSAQQAIIDGGTETKWDEQGLSWKLPSGWKKMDVKKEMFDYESPDNAFMSAAQLKEYLP